MTGLTRLPAYNGSPILYRGIDAEGALKAKSKYLEGKQVHWSAFSSASPVPQWQFANGGLLLRIRILSAGSMSRDIRKFSAFEDEDEVLLLPNFKTFVHQAAHFDANLGMEVIELQEMALHNIEVF